MRRAVPHGVGCEYPKYPAGGTASVLQYSQRSGVPPADPLGGRRRELCAACDVQATWNGGLVSISNGGTGVTLASGNGVTLGHVSVVNSTLANITVRAHC